MKSHERIMARRHLDQRLNPWRSLPSARPPSGWIRAIRQAFGMSLTQLGQRIGVSQPRASGIERAEMDDSITLDSLKRAAEALNCDLVYALVPRQPLEEMVLEQARLVARERIQGVSHSMALEDQKVSHADEEAQIERLAQELARQSPATLWQ